MNFNKMIETMNNQNLSYAERSEAAAKLWEAQNRINKNVKLFKLELELEAEEMGHDLFVESESGKYLTTVERQQLTPKLESVDLDTLRNELGQELFDQYVAHSYTIKWSDFKNAPQEVKDTFYSLPNLETMQTYQVKFTRA